MFSVETWQLLLGLIGAGGLGAFITHVATALRKGRFQRSKLTQEEEAHEQVLKQNEENFVVKQHRDLIRFREKQFQVEIAEREARHQAAIADLRKDMEFAKGEMHRLSGVCEKMYDDIIELRREADECQKRAAELENENNDLRERDAQRQVQIEQLTASVEAWSRKAIDGK